MCMSSADRSELHALVYLGPKEVQSDREDPSLPTKPTLSRPGTGPSSVAIFSASFLRSCDE